MSVLKQTLASLRLAVAIRYWHAARIILSQQSRDVEFMEPVGHLLSMAVELALKSYLLERGVTDREMGKQRIQHDLGAILRLCIQNNLHLGEQEVEMILVLRTAHLEHFHRYGPKAIGYAIVMANEKLALNILARVIDIISGDPRDLRHLHQRPHDLDWPLTEPTGEPVTLIRFNRMAAAAEDYAQQIEKLGEPHKRP
ncbi:hypothetical protein [Methylobacterium adhaesivum]|uniref:HEPN domain-containing protein n=1 Tax=Methylobacterium adhaesivum TaxID=333297 RepID=A0ABT8BJN3_9HYPH|nr:hypothetical protein [Methylobacterium adhaesivum]MDN3592383.1 hypothetical protein [Methylobacterium adhaesivum]